MAKLAKIFFWRKFPCIRYYLCFTVNLANFHLLSILAGADIILDFIGAPYWEKHSKCVATDGRIVHLGFVSRCMYKYPTVFFITCLNICMDYVVGRISAELNQSPGWIKKESDTHLFHSKKQVTGLQGATGQRCTSRSRQIIIFSLIRHVPQFTLLSGLSNNFMM